MSPSTDEEVGRQEGPTPYLDFEVEIGPGHGRAYPLAVVRSPAGEARATMEFPYDELALESALKSLQVALLRSGGPRRELMTPEETDVRTFGRRIFEALLAGDVRSLYDTSCRQAREAGRGLRLKLRILPPELARLPWEYVYDPRAGEYLSLSRDTPIVRFVEVPQPIEPLLVEPPLRILGMVAGPSDLAPLDAQRERERVDRALARLQTEGLVRLTWLDGQTWRDLQTAMRRGPWHVFHFIGHGGYDQNSGEGIVALADEAGDTHRMSATELGRLLADHHSLRLVILNSCESARGNERDLFSSTAAVLVRRGLPAVLAMQDEITDRAAIELSRAFYEALADGYPVDAAVAEARKAVSLAVTNTLEWGTPVLYMRAPQGVIFRLPPPGREGPQVAVSTVADDRRAQLDAIYTDALSAFWVEDWMRASDLFDRIVAIDPTFADAAARREEARRRGEVEILWARARRAIEDGDWDEAVAAWGAVLAEAPEDISASDQLAEARRQQRAAALAAEAERLGDAGQWAAVTKVVAQLREVAPERPGLDDLAAEAQAHVDEQRRQQRLDRLYRQAVLDLDAHRWAEAQAALVEIQSTEPDYRETTGLLARCQTQIEREREGVLAGEREAQEREELAATRYAQAVRLAKSGEHRAALDRWTEVLELAPDHPDPKHVRGRTEQALAAAAPAETPSRRQRRRWRWVMLAAGVVVALATAGTVLLTRGSQPAVPSIDDEFRGVEVDWRTWEQVGDGEVSQTAGGLTLIESTVGDPFGVQARATFPPDGSARFEVRLRLAHNSGTEDNLQMGLVFGDGRLHVKCAVIRGTDGEHISCWHSQTDGQPVDVITGKAMSSRWHVLLIEFDAAQHTFHYGVDSSVTARWVAPVDYLDAPAVFQLLVHNQGGPSTTVGYVDSVRIRPWTP